MTESEQAIHNAPSSEEIVIRKGVLMTFSEHLDEVMTGVYFDIIEIIDDEIQALKEFLLQKNEKYGNSAINPIRRFAKSDCIEQINVRIDDKLSRLLRGNGDDEDTELDLLGYLILKRVALRRKKKTDGNS